MTVTARSRSAPSYAPATFQQRPLFPRGLRSLLAVLLVVGDLGRRARCRLPVVDEPPRGGRAGRRRARRHRRRRHRRHARRPARSTPTATASPTRSPPSSPSRSPPPRERGPPQAGGSDRPTRTVLGGTVKAGETRRRRRRRRHADADRPRRRRRGDAEAAPAALTGSAGQARGGQAVAGALRPLRAGRRARRPPDRVRRSRRRAGPTGRGCSPTSPIGQSYELSFARPGYDTQSFVVTPTGRRRADRPGGRAASRRRARSAASSSARAARSATSISCSPTAR